MTYWNWIALTFITHILFGIYVYVTKIKNNASTINFINSNGLLEISGIVITIAGLLNFIPTFARISATGIGIVWIVLLSYRLIENVFMKIDSIGIKKDEKVVDEE